MTAVIFAPPALFINYINHKSPVAATYAVACNPGFYLLFSTCYYNTRFLSSLSIRSQGTNIGFLVISILRLCPVMV